MNKCSIALSFTIASLSALAFDVDASLAEARGKQLAQRTDRVLASRIVGTSASGVEQAENLLAVDGKATRLVKRAGERNPHVVLDLGAESLSGYAIIHVTNRSGATEPKLKITYSAYPDPMDMLLKEGDFGELGRGCYMTRDVEIPALPANVHRHELYTIGRTGVILAPMHQAQFRYACIQLMSDDTEVSLDAVEWYIGDFYDRQPLAGYFKSSDPVLDRHWQIGVWTSQFATIRDVWAWRVIEGWLLPRKLTKTSDVGLSKAAPLPRDAGAVSTRFEFKSCPNRIATAGLALFAADPENALLFSISEKGMVSWIRRHKGEDNVLCENFIDSGVRLESDRPYELKLVWKPLGEELFLSKGIVFEAWLDGRKVNDFTYYHGAQGERLGFFTPKGSWPIFDWIEVADKGGKQLFKDDFGDIQLAKWDFVRPEPVVVDGAKRDRLIWSGDLWWAGRNLYYSLADQYGMRESVRLLARAQTPDGFTHACPHPEIGKVKQGDYGMFESDEFAAWFVPVLYDYWLYTADRETLDLVWPALVKLMDYLDSFTGENGLFNQRFETSKHAFSAGLQAGDIAHRSYMDILLWECRKDASQMALDRGERELAAKWMAEAARTKTAIFKHYWDSEKGCMKCQLEEGSWGWDNDNMKMVRKPKMPWAMEANSFALASHILTPEQAKSVASQVHDNKWTIKYVVMAARGKAEYGMADESWRMISTNNWAALIDKDWDGPLTTPEGMNLTRGNCADQSHPDTALAGYISTAFLGIVPVKPGFKVFKFEPHPYASLDFAEGLVPTPFGNISARWERKDGKLIGEVTVPAGTECLIGGKTYASGCHRGIVL